MSVLVRLNGDELIGGAPGVNVRDFWSWAYSDLLTNTVRSLLAEFLVASALGETQTVRTEWDSVDVRYRGYKVEVKSSGYVQTWNQSKLSTIKFDIAPKYGWDANANTVAAERSRSADVYIFCLFLATEKEQAYETVRDTACWRFYPVTTAQLNAHYAVQKSIGLAGVQALVQPCGYAELKYRADRLLDALVR
jgi:hypothetical protein